MSTETIPGGRYLSADGVTWHDANGKVLEEGKPVLDAAASLPSDFPGRKVLLDFGLTTLESVQATSDETLLAIKGVGQSTLAAIRSYGK